MCSAARFLPHTQYESFFEASTKGPTQLSPPTRWPPSGWPAPSSCQLDQQQCHSSTCCAQLCLCSPAFGDPSRLPHMTPPHASRSERTPGCQSVDVLLGNSKNSLREYVSGLFTPTRFLENLCFSYPVTSNTPDQKTYISTV